MISKSEFLGQKCSAWRLVFDFWFLRLLSFLTSFCFLRK